ncbi:MAG: sulfite exporter TauE/SafE family protein [Nitrospirae bacterium]|nr:sulfite exporter TauE/SafE family protein [Nitrospirota bacterium]
MHEMASHMNALINLDTANLAYLFILGFGGGLLCGFMGAGGAFILTPGMMGIGIPALVAVASNMCLSFPKALVGSLKRLKYGLVDMKLAAILGVSTVAGVLVGADVQNKIRAAFGDAGSNLYVSVAFIVILAVVGGIFLKDVLKTCVRNCNKDNASDNPPDDASYNVTYNASGDASKNVEVEKVTRLARWIQSVNIPGTMVYFKSIDAKISVLFTIPIGFATGMMAATVAVGGFVGIPSMMYVLGAPGLIASATELVIAFVVGLGGSLTYAMHGMVDIRLAMVILAGSLLGTQLGAIGSTYVRPYMVKVVMAVTMLTVMFSRLLMVPVYLSQLGVIRGNEISGSVITGLKSTSFAIMVLALLIGAFIILKALVKGLLIERTTVLNRL